MFFHAFIDWSCFYSFCLFIHSFSCAYHFLLIHVSIPFLIVIFIIHELCFYFLCVCWLLIHLCICSFSISVTSYWCLFAFHVFMCLFFIFDLSIYLCLCTVSLVYLSISLFLPISCYFSLDYLSIYLLIFYASVSWKMALGVWWSWAQQWHGHKIPSCVKRKHCGNPQFL